VETPSTYRGVMMEHYSVHAFIPVHSMCWTQPICRGNGLKRSEETQMTAIGELIIRFNSLENG
jgi:hypothetical protein